MLTMPDDHKEVKARKLAAARRKLREYQSKDKRMTDSTTEDIESITDRFPSGATSATLSEKSDSELNLNGHAGELVTLAAWPKSTTVGGTEEMRNSSTAGSPAVAMTEMRITHNSAIADYFQATTPTPTATVTEPEEREMEQSLMESCPFGAQSQSELTIKVLINEKAEMSTELAKWRSLSDDKERQSEELRTQLTTIERSYENVQKRLIEQQQLVDELRSCNMELRNDAMQSRSQCEAHEEHVRELAEQLAGKETQLKQLDAEHRDKCKELELAQIRIKQISDETSGSVDSRIETLTQTQFMYEQQIRDLQAMVKQLSDDKEHANIQYQSYVQHLNAENCDLKEKNVDQLAALTKLQEREQQLVEHIGGLEREIQRNLASRTQLHEKETCVTTALPTDANKIELERNVHEQISQLEEKHLEFELERHEFQLKIKSQEDRLTALTHELHEKRTTVTELEARLYAVDMETLDKAKLLATIESDKVAASRALSQNMDLKQQLDELEQRFVQLTNDKADLMNRLDAEEFASRELRRSHQQMEIELRGTAERLQLKDDEMIRLSHENMDMVRKNLVLQQQVDQLKHYEVREYQERYARRQTNHKKSTATITPGKEEEDEEKEKGKHVHDNCPPDANDMIRHGHGTEEQHMDGLNESDAPTADESDSRQEVHREHLVLDVDRPPATTTWSSTIPTATALEKLEQRFTRLIGQMADMTEEKQRLEHLVLQLQSETETIGEYIALYQMQRRMLKQREYEKAAQLQLLSEERKQMQDKITMLNKLVGCLSAADAAVAPQPVMSDDLCSTLKDSVMHSSAGELVESAEEVAIECNEAAATAVALSPDECVINQKLNSIESQEILTKIQSIITEIKETAKESPPTVYPEDHLNCCVGKFEIV